MIGIDWGTTSLRAFRLDGRTILERREAPRGITTVAAGEFGSVLRATVGDWIAAGERRVLMAGMVGSRQGWIEAPYAPCPAGAAALVAALVPVPFAEAEVALVPGLSIDDGCIDETVPEVMRGEETQLVGAMATIGQDLSACLPGTHSKWARIEDGKIVQFATHLTGEAFAALRGHTILGRLMADAPVEQAPFLRGVARAEAGGGLLHHLFGVRTLGLFDRLGALEAASYLSGLLIGHEISAAAPPGTVYLIGAPGLCKLYAWALEARGVTAVATSGDLSALGLALMAEQAGWV